MTPRMYSIRRTQAGYARLAGLAALWGRGFFYTDGLRIALSSTERTELTDMWILTTDNRPTRDEIQMLLAAELS